MDFFEEIKRITGLYAAGVRAASDARMPTLKAAAARVADDRAGSSSADEVTAKSQPAAAPLGDGVEGVAVAGKDRDSEFYRKLQTKPVPQIWERVGRNIYKRGQFFCWCENEENAWFVADRLNAFDANLEERNMFQRMYLHSKEEDVE